ncbi:MAG TPA: hypothetical protein VMV10_16405 [Pirellulales bacterium]|nr:hypothetical protein [Pirellulales bacterium]
MICNFLVDRVDRYAIDIRPNGSYFTLHAITYPPNRRGGGVLTHHLYDSGKICVSAGNEPRTIDKAKAIAMFWCDGWSKFQRTGRFPNDGARVNVNS